MSKDAKEKMTTAGAVKELVRKDTVVLSVGTEVEVRLCKVKDIEVFVKFVASVFEELSLTDAAISDRGAIEKAVAERLNDPSFILKLISNKADQVFEIVARFTTLSVEEVRELDVDDAVVVLQKVVEINYDFFTVKVLPTLRAMFAGRTGQK